MANQPDHNENTLNNSTSDNQQSNPDWTAISKLIVSALSNAAKSPLPTPEKRIKFTDWLAIATLISTLVIQIGFAYVQNAQNRAFQQQQTAQNQDFQKSFLLYQKEAGEALLQFTQFTSTGFILKNNGLSATNNANITITLIYINPNWRPYFSDISGFTFINSKTTLGQSRSDTHKDVLPTGNLLGKNATILKLNPVAPGEAFSITFNFGDSESTKIISSDSASDVNLYFDKSVGDGIQLIQSYFKEKYAVAAFDININCDNCQSDINSSDEAVLQFSPTFEAIVPSSFHNQNLNGFLHEEFNVQVNYILPKAQIQANLQPSLNLNVSKIQSINPLSPETYVGLHQSFKFPDSSLIVWPNYYFKECNLSECNKDYSNP